MGKDMVKDGNIKKIQRLEKDFFYQKYRFYL
jgi:hypothetical protein